MTEILIVDDSAINRSTLERLVRGIERGAMIRTFASPDEALLAVRAGDPDLIVTGFSMPRMSGADFARRCRADPNFHAAIIVVTTLRDRGTLYAALEAGVADFLSSPVDHRELAIRVRNVLAATRSLKKLAAERRALDRERALDAVRIEEEVGRRTRRYRDVLDAITWPVLAVRADQRIGFANRAFAAMTDARLDELPGRSMTEILAPLRLAREALRAEAKARREGGPIVLATSIHGGAGAPLNLRVHACPIGDRADGEIVLLFAPAEAIADPAALLAAALIP
ncbi:MAG: sensory box/GGDEF family protein [Rhodospirillales bacterium]|jgi:DNA-binding NarL/FixJ family response regulator|nr:sensory box/GGDEF family protein [Rhodospirillales bacterium]